jgi:two-component system sensor histidine kinase QseC
VTLSAWGFAAFKSYQYSRDEVDALFDAHLAESASALLKQATHEWREKELKRDDKHKHSEERGENDDIDYGIDELRERGALLEKRLVFEFWDASGTQVFKSGKELNGVQAPDGFSDIAGGSVALRAFSQWNEERSLKVVVAESVDARVALANAAVGNVVQPILWIIVPLILLLAFVIEWTLRSIRLLSSEVGSRSVNDLKSIDEVNVPGELKPFIKSLNSLFDRLERAIQNERRFTADAAHELRTPLAAIKVQAQVAMKEANELARTKALEATVAGVDRATHLVEQLLTLARLDPEVAVCKDKVLLRSLVIEVLQEVAAFAIAKSQEVELAEGLENIVAGQRQLLAILLRNLFDNAIRYTPAGGRLHVAVRKAEDGVLLVVEDTGPGLNEQQLQLLGSRFNRVDRPSGEGSGLGLSIVLKIIAIHQASINFRNSDSGSGLIVTVCFPNSRIND